MFGIQIITKHKRYYYVVRAVRGKVLDPRGPMARIPIIGDYDQEISLVRSRTILAKGLKGRDSIAVIGDEKSPSIPQASA